MVAAALLITFGFCQEAEAEPLVALEIEVWGEPAIKAARSAIVRDMEGLGWRARPHKNGVTRFRPPHAWMGRARLTDAGSLSFGRKVVAMDEPVGVQMTDPREDFIALSEQPSTATVGPRMWLLPSRKVTDPVANETREAVSSALRHYVSILRATAIRDRMASISDALDSCWGSGTPFGPGPVLETLDQRREAILSLSRSRVDSDEGRATARAIDAWMRENWDDPKRETPPSEQ